MRLSEKVRLLGQTDAPFGGDACMPCSSVADGQSLMFRDGTGDLGQKVRASNLVGPPARGRASIDLMFGRVWISMMVDRRRWWTGLALGGGKDQVRFSGTAKLEGHSNWESFTTWHKREVATGLRRILDEELVLIWDEVQEYLSDPGSSCVKLWIQ